MNRFDFVRIAACSPKVAVGDPAQNVIYMLDMLEHHGSVRTADIVVFPELAISGYTCGDLFRSTLLLTQCERAVQELAERMGKYFPSISMLVVGAPIAIDNRLYNCAVVIANGEVIGIVPKRTIPNYREFYESRWFSAARTMERASIAYGFGADEVPFGYDLLFGDEIGARQPVIGIEICEDLWTPLPPSSELAVAGANILINLSASNEQSGKYRYRHDLVKGQSARCVAAYVYASAGPLESSSDLVFGGHCLISENGTMLSEHAPAVESRLDDEYVDFEDRYAAADVDSGYLWSERRMMPAFANQRLAMTYRVVPWLAKSEQQAEDRILLRTFPANPFVPGAIEEVHEQCAEIFTLQCTSLAKRLLVLKHPDVFIGVSGGLDSALALLVAEQVYHDLLVPTTKIHGITMPGFGTTGKTLALARRLMSACHVTAEEIDIRPACLQMFADLKHCPFGIDCTGQSVESFERQLQALPAETLAAGDLVFENVQARLRTTMLMSRGFVIGTGDMSELALGWCTYNGDHMSMYNPNVGIPKTLVRHMVNYVLETKRDWNEPFKNTEKESVLGDILKLTISPELLPVTAAGGAGHATEDTIGPYELHDFFLYHFVRNGFSPAKILFLAENSALSSWCDRAKMVRTLRLFLQRFFSQQYKRNCLPDGPKVGSVSLSPRGDWRMPSEADVSMWLADLDRAEHRQLE